MSLAANVGGTIDSEQQWLGLGYDAGRELMAHQVAYGRLDDILPSVQSAYSYLQKGVAYGFEHLPEELGANYVASFIRNHAGGLSANIATMGYGISIFARHNRKKAGKNPSKNRKKPGH